MVYSELSGLTVKDLNKKKKELQASMFDSRMKNTLGQLPNQMVIRTARKDIARINTALTLLAKKHAKRKPMPEALAEIASDVAAAAVSAVKKATKTGGAKKKPAAGKKG